MIPVYKLVINEELDSTQEVNAVAFVDVPAIGENFFAFKQHQKFAIVNEDERIVVGAAMIPNMLIYRKDETGEYNVVFDAETIAKIAQKFFEKGYQKNGNEMHDENKPVDVVFYQSWIADENKGIPKMKQFEDLPDGTWFLGAKVNSDETWAKVKDGTFKGFSVEGFFDMKPVKMSMSDEERLEKIKALLNGNR